MNENIFDVKEQVVVITGGYGVLGFSMARCFAEQGSKVAIVGRQEQKGAEAIEKLKNEYGAEVLFLKADVTNKEEVCNAAKLLIKQWGRCDVLINAAGGNQAGATIGVDKTIFDLELDAMKDVFSLNFMGTVIPSLEFGEYMAKEGQGSIINISSMSSQSVITRIVGYSTAKSAVDCFTRWLSVELAKKFSGKLRVNAIAPGFFITEQNRALLINKDGSYTARAEDIIRNTPFARFGEPEELHGVVLWLASKKASSFVSGVVVPVDGGFSVFSGV